MKVYSVHDVKVFRRSDNPLELLITAIGVAATTGWTNPRLDNSADTNPADAVLQFSFEADRPQEVVLQVLTPIVATTTMRPANGADAVVVSARTNNITVHASEFAGEARPGAAPRDFTTLAVGEEMPPTLPGAEGLFPTTFLIGEEQVPTRRIGEEFTTLRFGEEGVWTDPRVDDPFQPALRPTFTGEDPGPFRFPRFDPRVDPFFGGGNPFGGF